MEALTCSRTLLQAQWSLAQSCQMFRPGAVEARIAAIASRFAEISKTKALLFKPVRELSDVHERIGERFAVRIPSAAGPFGVCERFCGSQPRIDAPRSVAERVYANIQRWTVTEKGGHFAALEQPEALAREIRAFFRPLR